MKHRHRLSLALCLLLMLALIVPAAQPTAAQESTRILCLVVQITEDCDRIAEAIDERELPWTLTTISSFEFIRFLLTNPNYLQDVDVLVVSRESSDPLRNPDGNVAPVQLIREYVRAGGQLLLLDPSLGGDLDPTLAAPTEEVITRLITPEFTRAGRFTPNVGQLAREFLPLGNTGFILPPNQLGEAWITQSRAGFGDLSNVTLASALLGEGRIALVPNGLTNIDLVASLIDWICCIVIIGPDLRADALEVTQAIQDLTNSVDLVAGKRTYVRFHVRSLDAARNGVTATLTVRRRLLPTLPYTTLGVLTPINPGGTITVKTNPNRGLINDSFLFELPAAWRNLQGQLQLVARIDPANAVNDPIVSNNQIQRTVFLLRGPSMRLRLYNVRYTVGQTTHQASNFHLNALESWLRRAYPIRNLNVTRVSYTYPNAGLPNVDTLNQNMAMARLFSIIFAGLNPDTFYYGIVDDGGGFMRGKALGIPGSVSSGPTGAPSGSWGWDTDGSYGDWYGGHEIAHSLGRSHAEFCGAGGGTSFPYPNGRISPALTGNTAIYGFDITSRAIYPPDWRDVMTYCNNQWVSDFTYEGMRQRFTSIGSFQLASAELQQGSFLLIGGRVELATGNGSLGEIQVLDGTGTNTTTPGEDGWALVLVKSAGAPTIYPFTPAKVEDDEDPVEPAIFAEMVPWDPATTRIELRRGTTVVDQRAVSANAPTVNLTAPTSGLTQDGSITIRWTASDADGDSLTYAVLFSNDNGATWRSVATDLTSNELTIDSATLPGGTQSKFRVIASDGVLSGQADSDPLNIPTKAPVIVLNAPSDGAFFYPTQPVTFAATAYDLEDGELSFEEEGSTEPRTAAGDAFSWVSDQDGPLGTGSTLTIDSLSTGEHTITLTVTDSEGKTSEETFTITIASAETPLDELLGGTQLAVAPDVIGAVATFGSSPQSFTVSTSVLSDGTEPLTWTATVPSDAPWVRVRVGSTGPEGPTASGSTPDNLIVIVNPRGLPIGAHNTEVTVTSGNQTRIITVNLLTLGEQIYLPLVRR